MKPRITDPESVFSEIGEARWTKRLDAFVVRTDRGAQLHLSPNGDDTVAYGVHIDAIFVPERLRRRGLANGAMVRLCRVADRYRFTLEGGPVGFRDAPWREKFVTWVMRFGFVRDERYASLPIDDPMAFYVRRSAASTAAFLQRAQSPRLPGQR